MSGVKQFYQLTLKLIELLESRDSDRDYKIHQIVSILAEREGLLAEIAPPYTLEEMQIGQELIRLNLKVSELLKAEKDTIQKDIKSLKTKKETNNKYVNPYHTLTTDGMFYDKRK